MRREQTASMGAAKWKQLKATLKTMGRQRKEKLTIDHTKSAELLAELTAGAPAALMFASMFQRDERGHKKIPVLLEQLKVNLANAQSIVGKSGDRHLTFKIELEYGNGLTRMKWYVERTLRDFWNLHVRYRVQFKTQKYARRKGDDQKIKFPHFPNSVAPILRGARGLAVDPISEDDENLEGEQHTGPSSGEGNGGVPRPKRKRHQSSGILRRRSSLNDGHSPDLAGALRGNSFSGDAQGKRETWAERSRRKLELYLQQLIRFLIFRPESNRLCKFLELSALGVRLAAEGSFHGKEGTLTIQSSKGVDFRRALRPSLFKERHRPKWFLVRHSYVACVDS